MTKLLYSTYLGGSGLESAGKIQVDSDGNVYVTSGTSSLDFPVTEGAYLTTRPDPSFANLFVGVQSVSTVTKIDPASEVLLYSSYLDWPIADLAVDGRGAVVLAGPPRVLYFSPTGLSPNGETPAKGELTPLDAFLATLSPDGATVESVTEFGGSGVETVTDVELDTDGNAWITGGTTSADLPLTNPLRSLSKPEGFIAKFAPGGEVLFASRLPGVGSSLTSESAEAVVLGSTSSANIPTTADAYLSGPCASGFAMRVRDNGDLLYSSYLPVTSTTVANLSPPEDIEFTWLGLDRLESVRSTDPPPSFACVTHGASTDLIPFDNSTGFGAFLFGLPTGRPPALAPGVIVDLHGYGWGPDQVVPLAVSEEGLVATSLAGIRVLFNGVAAPLIAVHDRVIRAVVPFSLAGGPVTVRVESPGEIVPPLELLWKSTSPGIFAVNGTGDGQAAVINQDGSLNSATNPAPKGSVIAIFATGGGVTDPPSVGGAITPINGPYPRLLNPVTVSFGGFAAFFDPGPLPQAKIFYAGAAPGLVAGVIQINAKIPQDAPSGSNVRIHLRVGDLSINSVNAAIAPTIAIE